MAKKSLFGIEFSYPLPVIGTITSVLGDPRTYGGHEGYDIAVPPGTPVLAAAAGTVSRAGYMPDGYGYYVEVDHGHGVKTLYGHLLGVPAVVKGMSVKAGQTLGKVGATGNATGPHLHFHILANGVYQNVADFVDMAVSRARQGIPCLDAFLEGREAWNKCAQETLGINPTDDEYNKYAASAGAYIEEQASLPQGWPTLIDTDALLNKVEDIIYNVVFAAPRAMITAFKLNETPLPDGRATKEWLEQDENANLYLISIVLIIIFFLLIAVALRALLQERVQAQLANIIDNPATSVIESVS